MNFIEAWKQAKEGQGIRRKGIMVGLTKKLLVVGGYTLAAQINFSMNDDDFLADDWEVMKEKKTLVFQDDPNFIFMHKTIRLPSDAKVTVEWEE